MIQCRKLFSRLFHALPTRPPSDPQPWLFIGLGNPSEKYQSTRHNVGFDMIDVFAQSVGISMTTVHFKSYFGEGEFKGNPVLLAKPQTYMNLSGESTGPLAAYYKLPLNRILVIYDDMDLPCGVLRIQPGGGHGHHNGKQRCTLWSYQKLLQWRMPVQIQMHAKLPVEGKKIPHDLVPSTTSDFLGTLCAISCRSRALSTPGELMHPSSHSWTRDIVMHKTEECHLSFSWEQGVLPAKSWHWKATRANGPESLPPAEV